MKHEENINANSPHREIGSFTGLQENSYSSIILVMKLLLLLMPFSVFANHFQLKEAGIKFDLKITSRELSYTSEALSQQLIINECNFGLARNLNTEIFSKIPKASSTQGLAFEVDKRPIKVKLDSDFGKLLLAMDGRILRFLAMESSKCQ